MKDYKLEDIAKLIECQYCDGKGYAMRYPSYGINMPEMVKERCDNCHGRGIKLIVAGNMDVVWDSFTKIEYRYNNNDEE